jgi:hypothetical protein
LTIQLLQAEQAPALSAGDAQPAEAETRPARSAKESEDRTSSTNETNSPIPLPDADAITAAANRRRKAHARLDEIDANRERALHNANALLTACQSALPHATDYDKTPVIPPERRAAVADALLALWAGFRVERIDTGRLIDQMERQTRLIGGDTFGYVVHLAQRGRDGDREGAIQLLAELDKLPGRRDPDTPREVNQEGVWHAFVAQLRGLLHWSNAGPYLPDSEEGSRLAQELEPSQSTAVPSSPAMGPRTTGTNEDAEAPNQTEQNRGAAPGTADPPVYFGLPLLPADAPDGFNVFTGEPYRDIGATEYRQLACELLGVDELDEPPLPTITVDNVDEGIRRNVGDLTDRQDQELAAKLRIEPRDWDNLNEEQRIGRMGIANLLETKTAGYRSGTELSKILRELNNPPSDSSGKPSKVEVMPNPFDLARRPWLPILKECIDKIPELAVGLTEEKLRNWLWRKYQVPPTQELHAEQLVRLFERAAPHGPPSAAEKQQADRPPEPTAEVPPADHSTEAASVETDPAQRVETLFRFERDLAVWHIRFDDEAGSISDNDFTGLKYIARLLAHPHQAVAADLLYPLQQVKAETHSPERAFDAEGRSAVEREAVRLKGEIEEARSRGALARVDELTESLQQLADSHAKDKTQKGKARRLRQTPLEQAAERVRKAIRAVRAELRKRGMTKLADHLERIKKETTSYAYRPEKPEPSWHVAP